MPAIGRKHRVGSATVAAAGAAAADVRDENAPLPRYRIHGKKLADFLFGSAWAKVRHHSRVRAAQTLRLKETRLKALEVALMSAEDLRSQHAGRRFAEKKVMGMEKKIAEQADKITEQADRIKEQDKFINEWCKS